MEEYSLENSSFGLWSKEILQFYYIVRKIVNTKRTNSDYKLRKLKQYIILTFVNYIM